MEHAEPASGFPGESLVLASLVGAALAGVPALLAGGLLLVNLEGPVGEHQPLGLLASAGVAVVAATLGYVGSRWLLQRPVWVLLPALVTYGAALLVLHPAPIDVHESFAPQANEREECHGWTFSHYPPGVMDGSSTTYCVGVETYRPAG